MTQASVVDTRFKLWWRACLTYGFNVRPPLTADMYARLPPGLVRVHAERQAMVDRARTSVTLDVDELWIAGNDLTTRADLTSEGCTVAALSWHIQIGRGTGPEGAERLDVVGCGDDTHPRVHRHPYGRENDVREPAHLPPPEQWLSFVDHILGGALADHLLAWNRDVEQ